MFKEITASKKSIVKRSLVYGVGINDADYIAQIRVGGKYFRCPYYVKWIGVLRRCYSEGFHVKYPTYRDCTICEEWLLFSNFKRWMIKQDWQGNELDKDLIQQGNKFYSPELCAFIPHDLNNLLNDHGAKRGKYPQGVYFKKDKGKFTAQISINCKRKFLGYFDTPDAAYKEYKTEKYTLIRLAALSQSDLRLRDSLLQYVIR